MRFFTKAASVNATEKMRITPDGDVGIGTTSPGRTLHILGQTGIGTVLKLEGAAGTTTYLQLSYNGATNAQSGYIGYDSSANMPFFTNNTERMRITACGYVAVTGNQALSCVPYLQGMSFGWNRSNGQGESMINWTNAGGGTSCDLTFNFRDSSTLYERLRIASTGAATFACSVNAVGLFSTTSASGNLASKIRNGVTSASGTTGYGLAIESEASAASSYALTVRNLAETTTYLHILTETGRVGNVGINTTAPNYKLEVNGTSCFAGNVAIGGTYCAFALNVHGVTYQIGGSIWVQNGYGYVNSGAVSTGLFPQSDCTIQLRIANSAALTINSTQNVGLGSTTPKTRAFVLGLAGGQAGAGGCGCSAYSGGGKPAIYSYYGDQFGNGAPYGTSVGVIAPYEIWYGGGAGGYFKGGDGDPSPGGGAAGIVAIGGNGSTYAAGGAPYAEGGAGIYARGGFNQDGTTRTWAGYFDGCVYACGITTSDFVNVSAASSAYYGLKVAGVSGAARAIFLAGQVGYSNGFTVDYTGTAMKYSFINGNVGIGTTDACSILDVRGTITNGSTAGSNSTIDVSPAKQSIASGGYVDFPSMSGMIVVNDWADGAVTIFLAGGGSTCAVGSVSGTAGTVHYNSAVAGYRWCNNKGYTSNFGFLVFKTRITA